MDVTEGSDGAGGSSVLTFPRCLGVEGRSGGGPPNVVGAQGRSDSAGADGTTGK